MASFGDPPTTPPRSPCRMTDVTRLVAERKQIELQLLKLEQAMSALTIDANLNATLKPDQTISEDAQDSIAAVEVMMETLQQRKLDLTNEIEAARHQRHDVATEMQEKKEEKLLSQSEASMKRHLAQSKKVADHTLKKIAKKNDEHDRRVGVIHVSRQIETSRALTSLQKSILARERADAEKKRKKEEERAMRYAAYCRRERERALRLEQLEALRVEHHTSLVSKKSPNTSAAATPEVRGQGEDYSERINKSNARERGAEIISATPTNVNRSLPTLQKGVQWKHDRRSPRRSSSGAAHHSNARQVFNLNSSTAGAGLSAARDLGNKTPSPPPSRSISPSLLAPPGRMRVGSLKELDAKTAAGRTRHQKLTERVIARLGKAHAELEVKVAVHKDQRYRETMRTLKEQEAERAAAQERIEEMRREQEAHVELTRIEREQRTAEAIRRANLRNADFRWSRRAQRLIESVCSEIVATPQQ